MWQVLSSRALTSQKKLIVFFASIKALLKWWIIFLFHLKFFPFSRYLKFFKKLLNKFLSRFFSCRRKDLIGKIRSISKFTTSQPVNKQLQYLTKLPKLPNISRTKDNQAIKFRQLIEYYKRNIFLQKSCRKWGRETSSGTFFFLKKIFLWGKSKWSAG